MKRIYRWFRAWYHLRFPVPCNWHEYAYDRWSTECGQRAEGAELPYVCPHCHRKVRADFASQAQTW